MGEAFPGWSYTYPSGSVKGTTITGSQPGQKIANALEELQEKVVAAVVSETVGLEAKITGNTLYLNWGRSTIGASGEDLNKFCFGLEIVGVSATIKAGEVDWGTVLHAVSEQTFLLTADYQYIGIESDLSSAVLLGPSTNIALFRSDAMKKRTWLYQFRYTAATEDNEASATLHRIGKPLGNWQIGSEFA